MFRAFLIAIGISMCIVGGECLVVEEAVLAYPRQGKVREAIASKGPLDPFSQQSYHTPAADSDVTRKEFKPPEWAPWSLLSGGVIVSLYALTVQRD